MEGVCGFHKSHLTPPSGEHLLWHYPIGYTNSSCFGHFIVKKISSWHVCP
jgi:hypothetical protein